MFPVIHFCSPTKCSFILFPLVILNVQISCIGSSSLANIDDMIGMDESNNDL
jgi:hypothetical protein